MKPTLSFNRRRLQEPDKAIGMTIGTSLRSIYGTIIRTWITCKKFPCYMHGSACMGFIVKEAKIFWSYVKHVWILARVRKRRVLIGLYKQVFLNYPTIFLYWHNKKKLLPAFFFAFNTFNEKKSFLQSVTVLTIIISLYFNETKKN